MTDFNVQIVKTAVSEFCNVVPNYFKRKLNKQYLEILNGKIFLSLQLGTRPSPSLEEEVRLYYISYVFRF